MYVQSYQLFIRLPNNYKEKSSQINIHQLPIHDLLCHPSLGEIHPKMHTGNLGYGIFKPCGVRLSGVIGKLLLSLLEELVLTS